MTRLIISASARRDISNALDHSAQRWGAGQRRQYRALIESALSELLACPEPPASQPRAEILPGIRTFHIARRGRPARHFIVYRITASGDIQLIRLLHDAMELSHALPAEQ